MGKSREKHWRNLTVELITENMLIVNDDVLKERERQNEKWDYNDMITATGLQSWLR